MLLPVWRIERNSNALEQNVCFEKAIGAVSKSVIDCIGYLRLFYRVAT